MGMQFFFMEGKPAFLAAFITIILICYSIWKEILYKKKEHDYTRLSLLIEALDQDIVVFDGLGRSLESKKPCLLNDYLRKIGWSFGNKIIKFKESIENRKEFETFIDENGKSQYIFKTFPLLVSGKKYSIVSILDVSKYFLDLLEVKKSFEEVRNFLDLSPFGVVYLDDECLITGVNSTICNWLCIEKEEIIGTSIFKFLKDESNLNEESVKIFVNYDDFSFKTLWIPSDSIKNAYLVCKVNLDDHGTFDFSPIPSVIVSQNGEIRRANSAFLSFIEDNTNDSFIYSYVEEAEDLKKIIENGEKSVLLELQIKSRYATGYLTPIDDIWLIQFIDISEQKRLEQQFIQSQKMQAVGQLAGGIAHDFNNLLTAMIGFCDLLLQRYLPNDPSYSDIIQIKQSGNRAANLVRQLLAFSRQQTLQSKVVQITDTLSDLSSLLRRLIGSGVELKVFHDRDLWPVKVDPGQFEQVIINLAVNARDAMQESGILTIKTSNFSSKLPKRLTSEILPPGDYVEIDVSDSGHGIKKEHLNHIFEPFFSTKQMGSGTGLGLSTVYGIVHQTGGAIGVETIVGKGTTFKIFIPRYIGSELVQNKIREIDPVDLSGRETILFVEDEDAVRRFGTRALKEKGYNVIEASSGEAALEIIEKGLEFDLLITDVVMPRIDGPTLCKKLREQYKQVKVIFISGYAEDTFRKNVDDDSLIHFLGKPFTLNDLVVKVKEVLSPKSN